MLVVATLTFFPNGMAAAVRERLRAARAAGHAMAAPAARDVQTAQVAELLSATQTLAGASADRPASDAPILRIEAVSKSYGALRAVDGVSLRVPPRSLHGLMGPNGAGKTTLFNVDLRFHSAGRRPRAARRSAARYACRSSDALRWAMTRTFQHAAVFQRLSCLDNVMIGLGRNGVWRATMRSVGAAFDTAARRGRTPRGARGARRGRPRRPRTRSSRLALARRPASPRDWRARSSRDRSSSLLDEPVSGVAVEEAHRLRELLLAINRELGIAMVVIEHNIGFLVSLCRASP